MDLRYYQYYYDRKLTYIKSSEETGTLLSEPKAVKSFKKEAVIEENNNVKNLHTDEVKQQNHASFDDVKIRTNFNETAFFYPNLHTDKNGNILIKFKIPEALTKWKFLSFAHTKDLKYGFSLRS